MIDRQALLKDLQALLRRLEADLLERSDSDEVPEVGEWLREEYTKAKDAERTAQTQKQWIDDFVTQVAAAWVLSCVFARFFEDNELVDPPRIAGPGKRLERARDEHTLFFQDAERAKLTDREYLLDIFAGLAKLPAVKDLFASHNPMNALPNWLGPDAAGELLRFFQLIDAETGELVRDFADPEWDARFLGDLYQDLSEAARKKYALLQTPEFIEEFILDWTLDPALDEFGLTPDDDPEHRFRMIDPACGSGHFLLGAFPRILERWQKQEPGVNSRELVQRSLDSVHGVDVNPYAVVIARFRLLLAALKECGITRLAAAPAFQMNLACGDSLYHGVERQQHLGDWTDASHHFRTEDAENLRRILKEGNFHCVVANPPYITPKDRAANYAYRRLYSSCHMKYSLAVPFMERIFRLAVRVDEDVTGAGYTGQITANSFMKREFGKKLIEEFLPTINLTHVIDTSGAYIPGHGTPTVILFGKNQKPMRGTVRTAMGIRGEPSTPDDPSRALVWSAIIKQIDRPGSQSDFVSVGDSERARFRSHPWSIGGGGAAELKEQLETIAKSRLSANIGSTGFMAITGEDDVFVIPNDVCSRYSLPNRPFIVGDMIRDWRIDGGDAALFLYDDRTNELESLVPSSAAHAMRFLWSNRTLVRRRSMFGKSVEQHGFRWYEYMQFIRERVTSPLLIAFSEVATHNHFVLNRGGKVFKQTAPVIKLPADATEDAYLSLLGLLNSSTACFWMKQVCHQKQMMGGDGIRIESKAKVPYAFNATALGRLPVPTTWHTGPLRDALLQLARRMDEVSQKHAALTADAALTNGKVTRRAISERWDDALRRRRELRSEQVFLQEQIDFTVYRMFDLVSDDLVTVEVEFSGTTLSEGDRPFCILDGDNEDGFAVPQGVPRDWNEDLRVLWQRRIDAIRQIRELRLIESSVYKRRWIGRQGVFNHQRADNELSDAAKAWLTNRLERHFDFDGRMNHEGKPTSQIDISLISVARLADIAAKDNDFMEIGSVCRDDPAFSVPKLVEELVAGESVAILPIFRYKPNGLRKREQWEQTWELQRKEDAGEDVGDIPIPPKYQSSDFISAGGAKNWKLRGKLDVPKERWISFPHCEGEDGTLMICWAGYDHLQQAKAISAHFVDVQERLGGRDDPRLVPLLACLIELHPWLKQWHNEVDPEFGMAMGDYFEGFITEEARGLGKTIDEIKAWKPPKKAARRRRKAKT